MLTIKNLHKHFSGVVALSDVSLQVQEQEIYSLIGPNGSGKSTLFNCINGFNRPQNGQIVFNHTNLLQLKPEQIIKNGIARTFQNIQNVPYLTVLDNILLGAHTRINNRTALTRWVSRKARCNEEALGLEILDFLGIVNYEGKYLAGQPYGIHKLVEIGRALIAKPKLILLDEPAAGMNEQETLEIAKIISEIRKDLHITILLVEHDMKLVMSISDRICVLDAGIILAEGTPKEIKANPEVIRAFLGEGNYA